MIFDELNVFLEKLGLTEYESKTLSALFKLREAEAPEISRVSQVPKTRVYDVLDKLTNKGLIIEVQGRPKRYRSLEPEKVFELLLSEIKGKLRELEEEANRFKTILESSETSQREQFEKVMKVKSKRDFLKILGQEIDTAKKSVKAITPLEAEHSIIKENLANASARNVEVKLISKINEVAGKSLAQELSKTGVEIKEVDHGLNAYIIDDKKLILALNDFSKKRPEYHFTIWHNNEHLVDALSKYFEDNWNKK